MATFLPKVEAASGHLTEIFISAQGEGPYVGVRQLFLRFLGCNLDCFYCDTPETKRKMPVCRVEKEPGTWEFDILPNPIERDRLLQIVDNFLTAEGAGPLHSIAITGGEPLLQHRFLRHLLPELKRRGHQIYLETSGEQWRALAQVVKWVDIVAMDMKLPSSSGEREMWEDHRRFLAECSGKRVFVKAVVAAATSEAEIIQCANIIAEIAPNTPLILQPVTPFDRITEPAAPALLFDLQSAALGVIADVRIIPQCHKMFGAM